MCRSYGFYERSCPFIYTLEGESIGDGSDFVEHVRTRYCRANVNIEQDTVKSRTQENIRMIEEQMRKIREGMTLQEKIAEHQEKVLDTNVVSHITDAFFEQVEEGGDIFHLRRTNLMRDNGRTLNIIDEIEVA